MMRLAQPLARDETDPLTGLGHAAAARAWLDHAASIAPVHAMLIGLPRLPAINLARGVEAGDRVLVAMAQRLAAFGADALDGPVLLARMGGGQFLLASTEPASRERWQGLADTLAVTLGRPLEAVGGLRLAPRIALLRGRPGDGASALLDRLDQALSSLRGRPGQRSLWADGSHRARGVSAARLEADLLGAIEAEAGIAVLFQPQFGVENGALCGAEALVRWDHPVLGRIGAETLFAIAERGDHMVPLSRHIAHCALDRARGWAGQGGMRVSLNITAADLATDDFVSFWRGALDRAGLAAPALRLEITEQSLIADVASSAAKLAELAALGVAVSLDDFGSGFANFRMLKALPLDALKLDASLVRDVALDARDRAILGAIVAMARALGLKVVAEGIETETQLAVLREEGCQQFQGFLRSGPLEPPAMDLLAAG